MTTKILRGDRCQCPACGLYFTSTNAFDKHRTGKHGEDRRCLADFELAERGWEPNDGGFWRKPAPAALHAA